MRKLEKMIGNDQQVSIYPHMTLCALDMVCGKFIISVIYTHLSEN
jgi:hypothetical protein